MNICANMQSCGFLLRLPMSCMVGGQMVCCVHGTQMANASATLGAITICFCPKRTICCTYAEKKPRKLAERQQCPVHVTLSFLIV